MTGRLIVVGLFAAFATPAGAQIVAFSARPSVVHAGGYHTVRYTFAVGAPGFAKGGGVRIEIPVAYAETGSLLLWSAPQAENPELPGYVTASVSTNARTSVHIEGLLRGIVQADFADAVPAGATVSIVYRGQVQGIAGQIDARYAWRAEERDAWSVGRNAPQITIRPTQAQLVQVHYASDVARNSPVPMSIVALDKYGNVASEFTGTLALQSTDPSAEFPRTVTFRAGDRGRVLVRSVVFRTSGFQKITATDPAKRVTTAFKYALVSDTLPGDATPVR